MYKKNHGALNGGCETGDCPASRITPPGCNRTWRKVLVEAGRITVASLIFALSPFAMSRVLAQNTPPDISSRLILVHSADASGWIEQSRLTEVFWHLIQEQRMPTSQLPLIVVLHTSKKMASRAGLSKSALWFAEDDQHSKPGYYELWLVGKPAAHDYILGLQTVLEHEFGLHYSEQERRRIVSRAETEDSATVDAKNLAHK